MLERTSSCSAPGSFENENHCSNTRTPEIDRASRQTNTVVTNQQYHGFQCGVGWIIESYTVYDKNDLLEKCRSFAEEAQSWHQSLGKTQFASAPEPYVLDAEAGKKRCSRHFWTITIEHRFVVFTAFPLPPNSL